MIDCPQTVETGCGYVVDCVDNMDSVDYVRTSVRIIHMDIHMENSGITY